MHSLARRSNKLDLNIFGLILNKLFSHQNLRGQYQFHFNIFPLSLFPISLFLSPSLYLYLSLSLSFSLSLSLFISLYDCFSLAFLSMDVFVLVYLPVLTLYFRCFPSLSFPHLSLSSPTPLSIFFQLSLSFFLSYSLLLFYSFSLTFSLSCFEVISLPIQKLVN